MAGGGAGPAALGSFTDLTKFVASDTKRGPYDGLAREIGSEVYADVNGWHLYLRDMKACESLKMDMALAVQIGPQVDRNGYDERDVEDVVRKVGVKLGGGKRVPLTDLLSSYCMEDLQKIVERWADDQ